MTPAQTSPARSELIGSMIRPPEVIEAFKKVFPSRDLLGEFPQGQGSAEARKEFELVTQAAIKEIVDRQAAAGVDVVVNGEFDRWTWWMGLYGALDGFAMDREPLVARNEQGETVTLYVPRTDRKIKAVANPAADEARTLAKLTDKPFKVTIPCASRELMVWGRPVIGAEVYSEGVYDNPDEAFAELQRVQKGLVDGIVEAGAPYIQFDYPVFPHIVDDSWMKVFHDGGVKRAELVDRAIKLENDMIENVPENVTTGIHFCRGNIGNKFLARGGLDSVAERVFSQLNYDVLLIEWSEPERHGGFEPLRFVPPGVTVVLGIVDSKGTEIETEDYLIGKIEEASKYLDVSQLAISPQCGFSSAVGSNDAMDAQWRKIDVQCRVAERVWGSA